MLNHKTMLCASVAVLALGVTPALSAGNYISNKEEAKGPRYQISYDSREEMENKAPVDLGENGYVHTTRTVKTSSAQDSGISKENVLLEKGTFHVPRSSKEENEHGVPEYQILSSYDKTEYSPTKNEPAYNVDYYNENLPINATYGRRDEFQKAAMSELKSAVSSASRIDVSSLDEQEREIFSTLRDYIASAHFEIKMMDEVEQSNWHQTKLQTAGMIDRIKKQSHILRQQS